MLFSWFFRYSNSAGSSAGYSDGFSDIVIQLVLQQVIQLVLQLVRQPVLELIIQLVCLSGGHDVDLLLVPGLGDARHHVPQERLEVSPQPAIILLILKKRQSHEIFSGNDVDVYVPVQDYLEGKKRLT